MTDAESTTGTTAPTFLPPDVPPDIPPDDPKDQLRRRWCWFAADFNLNGFCPIQDTIHLG